MPGLARIRHKRRATGRARGSGALSNRTPITALWNNQNQRVPYFNGVMRLDNKSHDFVQTTNIGVVFSSNNATPQGYGRSFTSADITQFSSFATIFDQYKIRMIEAWLAPTFVSSSPPSGLGASGQFYTVTDYDNDATPSNSTTLMQYTNVMVSAPNEGHYRKWIPHIATAAFGASAFSQFANKPAEWIDVVSTSVAHYGFKAVVEPLPTGQAQAFNLTVRMHVSFRNTI